MKKILLTILVTILAMFAFRPNVNKKIIKLRKDIEKDDKEIRRQVHVKKNSGHDDSDNNNKRYGGKSGTV